MNHLLLHILVTTLYFVALINPVSKVSVLTVLSSEKQRADFLRMAARTSFMAACILLGSMIFGNFLLQVVFRVELYALRVSGGAILSWIGFNALRHGVFFEQEARNRFEDITLVPLACPMIAGPATIAAAIEMRAQEGLGVPLVAVVLAVGLNHLVMVFSRQLSGMLGRFNLLGALVRLTGLIVMTIGIQMALDGIATWWTGLP